MYIHWCTILYVQYVHLCRYMYTNIVAFDTFELDNPPSGNDLTIIMQSDLSQSYYPYGQWTKPIAKESSVIIKTDCSRETFRADSCIHHVSNSGWEGAFFLFFLIVLLFIYFLFITFFFVPFLVCFIFIVLLFFIFLITLSSRKVIVSKVVVVKVVQSSNNDDGT